MYHKIKKIKKKHLLAAHLEKSHLDFFPKSFRPNCDNNQVCLCCLKKRSGAQLDLFWGKLSVCNIQCNIMFTAFKWVEGKTNLQPLETS